MANLTLESARVLLDGRVLRVVFQSLTGLAQHGIPDWIPGNVAGKRLKISKNDSECEFLSATSVDFNMPPMSFQALTNVSSTLEPGKYYARLVFFDASGVVAKVSTITGKFDSGPNYPLVVAANQSVQFDFPMPVPAGHTASLYLTTVNGPPTDLRRVASGIAAGTTKYIVAQANTGSASDQPPSIRAWNTYWLIPEPHRVIYKETGLTVTAEQGLISDEFGNETTELSAVPIQNDSIVEADGWLTDRFGLSTNAVTIYVSSTHGSDSNPGTLLQPVATVAKAFSLLPNSSGSRVRFLRGDTFPVAVKPPQKWGVDGSPDTPLIFEDYWRDYTGTAIDPGTRPILDSLTSGADLMSYNLGSVTRVGSIIMRRLHFIKARVDCRSGGDRFVLSDCLCDDAPFTPNGDYSVRIDQAMLHRTSIFNCHVLASEGARVQGMHTHNTTSVLISESVFDLNGYRGEGASAIRDLFNHNAYIQVGTTETLAWGSWFLRGGSHGIQIRGGGGAIYNVFSSNAIAGQFNSRGGYFRKQVIIHSDDLTITGGGRGQGLAIAEGSGEQPLGGVIEFCIAAHHRGNQPTAFGASWKGNATEFPARFTLHRHNLAYDHGHPFAAVGTRPNDTAIVERNIWVSDTRDAENHQVYSLNVPIADLSWLTTRANVLSHPRGSVQALPILTSAASPQARTIAQWRALGQDLDSLDLGTTRPTFVDSNYGLQSYAVASGAAADEAGFFQAVRTRAAGVWPSWIRGEIAYGSFAAAYTPTTLPAINATPFGFYGPSDYRSLSGTNYQLSIQPSGYVGEPLLSTVEPSQSTTETVSLSDGGAGGAFAPASLTWSGDMAIKTFTYTPATSGIVVIKVMRDGVTVAEQSLTVKRKARRSRSNSFRGGFNTLANSL